MKRGRGRQPQPFLQERPDALELMARLLVSGGYRIPVAGTGTKPGLQSVDIAAAAGLMQGKLGRDIAIMVATRADAREIGRFSTRVYAKCRRAVHLMRAPRALDLSQAQDRWRLRMIIYDAAHELVHPERRRPYKLLAADAKMRAENYRRAHKVVTAELQELMNNASREFISRLWGVE